MVFLKREALPEPWCTQKKKNKRKEKYSASAASPGAAGSRKEDRMVITTRDIKDIPDRDKKKDENEDSNSQQ